MKFDCLLFSTRQTVKSLRFGFRVQVPQVWDASCPPLFLLNSRRVAIIGSGCFYKGSVRTIDSPAAASEISRDKGISRSREHFVQTLKEFMAIVVFALQVVVRECT